MKVLRFLSIVAFSLLLVQAAFSQRAFPCHVSEVIDGKTVAIEMNSGKLTAVLQYVEVPEPGQQFEKTVKDHLSALVLGRPCEFFPHGILPSSKTLGRLTVNLVDISMQMLRDGAAWHAPAERSGQSRAEAEAYALSESQAKAEKRGIWSVKDLKSPWEYRAELAQAQTKKDEEEYSDYRLSYSISSNRTPGRPQKSTSAGSADVNFGLWADVYSGIGNESPGLTARYDPDLQYGFIATSGTFAHVATADDAQKLECRSIYLYKNWPNGTREKIYLIGFLSVAADSKFARSNALTITADKQRLSFGSAKRFAGDTSFGVNELLLYRVSRASLVRISKAGSLNVKIGQFSGTFGDGMKQLVKDLLASTD
jgi:endonuclease YncB( thermonuclease family)